MFRKNKSHNKAKLEHKLCLARETPEPVFDIADCGLRHVPSGVYSLCRVFLKESLLLEKNSLSSLSGGGDLKDLHLLRVLDLHDNNFETLPDDIYHLKNLSELYLNDNHLKKLPGGLGCLVNLKVLNVANNCLKVLPDNFGDLTKLQMLSLNGNKLLDRLPKSMCKCQRLKSLEMDTENFVYPPKNVILEGVESIIRHICCDVGVPYTRPDDSDNEESSVDKSDKNQDTPDAFEAKIWTLENIKKQKLQDFLELEKANEVMQRQEFELAQEQKLNREKLLADISLQQSRLDSKLMKVQQERETERFRLIEQVQEAEQNADVAINQLLELNREPLSQLLELERYEEERLLAAANKHNEILRKGDILADMQFILQQESRKFELFHEQRIEVSNSVLEQELQSDQHLSEILQNQELHKAELMTKLQEDSDLQRAAVATLLERGDARCWGLVQQVRLVESQLAALTVIEMDKNKLQMDQHLNDLADKRISLSILLLDLLEQQKERRNQLLSTLHILEEYSDSAEDFWLRQYQRLLDKFPEGLSEAQKNMDPALAQALLMNGVINCLPFLAKLTQCQYDLKKITDNDLSEAGIVSESDRSHILDAFQMYKKQQTVDNTTFQQPSAPVLPVEEASAPPEDTLRISSTECVICFENPVQIIYVPCGHLCCCSNCSTTLTECPMCRAVIERKIRMVIV